MAHNYRARIRMNGGIYPATVSARTPAEARIQLEAIYGAGSVVSLPERC